MSRALLLLLVACNPFRDGTVTGKLESKGDAGDWVLTQGTCYSGQREQYMGMIAYGPDGTGISIKLVKDAVRGWSAVINRADTCKSELEKGGCRAIVLAANNCAALDVDHTTTNTTINDVRAIDGKLRIDCSTDTGSIKGELTFERCH
jgi:hypothetical protein